MRLSGGVEWAVHACISLSQASAPVPANRLAELHGVSPTYLAKHLQALARAGLIRSKQGKVGGYELTRPAGEISVLDVVLAIDGDEPAFRCTEIRQRGPLAAPKKLCTIPCAVAKAMWAAEEAYRASLATVKLTDLTDQIQDVTDGSAMPRLRDWLLA